MGALHAKIYSLTVLYSPLVRSMDEAQLEELIRPISAKALKDEAKKRGIPLGRCPTKMDIAKKLPPEALKQLSK
jgi:hypothetical protein